MKPQDSRSSNLPHTKWDTITLLELSHRQAGHYCLATTHLSMLDTTAWPDYQAGHYRSARLPDWTLPLGQITSYRLARPHPDCQAGHYRLARLPGWTLPLGQIARLDTTAWPDYWTGHYRLAKLPGWTLPLGHPDCQAGHYRLARLPGWTLPLDQITRLETTA